MSVCSQAASYRQQDPTVEAAYPLADRKSVQDALSKIPSRKRKIAELDEALFPFHVSLCPNSQDPVCITVLPLFTISRSCLSLSTFDQGAPLASHPHKPFFSATIAALEEDALASNGGPNVLIARFSVDNRLYAIEKARIGLYAFCRLAIWVDEQHLRSQASVPSVRLSLKPSRVDSAAGPWWGGVSLSATHFQERPVVKRQKIAPSVPAVEEQPSSRTTLAGPSDLAATPLTDLGMLAAAAQMAPVTTLQEPSQTLTAATSQDVDHATIEQYLDTLYLSGASLAYFVKGPLSRARAFHAERQSLSSLAQLLRDNILTVQSMNKRYTEYLPSTIRACMVTMEGHQIEDSVSSRKKKANKRGLRRRKDGSMPGEEDVAMKWWLAEDASVSAASDTETTIRERLSPLRFRETLLQLVVILEALTIEKICSDLPSVDAISQDPAVDGQDGTAEQASTAMTKPKKPKDLASLAETLVDRLTIWQSIEVSDDKAAEKKSQALGRDSTDQPVAENSDKLKDFCLDTMIPFYDSRLPQLIGKLSEKMGLPSMSPLRRKRGTTELVSKLPPGTAISRGAPTNAGARRPFSRVASDTMSKSVARPPSLMRSATDTNIFQRGKSSTPASAFMDAAMSRPPSRQSVSRDGSESQMKRKRSLSRANSMTLPNKSFTQREVDLSAMTKFNEARARKKANVEDELKTAIATLKKPNRGLAVKEVMADAEARHSKQHRPASLGQRRGLMGVQVNATPKRAQKRRDVLQSSGRQAPDDLQTHEPEAIPSTMPFVPASVIRPVARSSFQSSNLSNGVAQTPSRSKQLDTDVLKTPSRSGHPYSGPSGLQAPQFETHPFATPTKPGKPLRPTLQGPNAQAFTVPSTPASLRDTDRKIEATPLQASKTKENLSTTTPLKKSSQSNRPPETSIYDSLGWDD